MDKSDVGMIKYSWYGKYLEAHNLEESTLQQGYIYYYFIIYKLKQDQKKLELGTKPLFISMSYDRPMLI